MNRIGIIMAGGKGSRLYPLTKSISKHLLPINDRPMIFYPLSILLLLKIKQIIIVVNRDDLRSYKNLLGDGSDFGIQLIYSIQENPGGIAEGIVLNKNLIKNKPIVLILGDNIFYSNELISTLSNINSKFTKNTIIACKVDNPKNYGVAIFKKNKLYEIIEKPKNKVSDLAIPGIYFYNSKICNIINKLQPSKRGELEISDLNNMLLSNSNLECIQFGRGFNWFDAGSFENLNNAGTFIRLIEKRVGKKILCPEEIAFNNNFINKNAIKKIVKKYKNEYGSYLKKLLI